MSQLDFLDEIEQNGGLPPDLVEYKPNFTIELKNGSYLLMKGNFQDEWQHRIAKSSKAPGSRVNLTFRILK